MIPILNFLEFAVQSLLTIVVWIIFAYALCTWLVSFQIINLRNRFAFAVWRFLEGVATPILRPFRRIVPQLGGVDFSAVIFFIVVLGAQRYLIPPLFEWLRTLAGGGVTAT